MTEKIDQAERYFSRRTTGLERRGLLRIGSLLTAFTGASAVSALSSGRADAAPGDKNASTSYVPTSEKGAASGVATLDLEGKIPPAQLPDLSATIGRVAQKVINVAAYGAAGDWNGAAGTDNILPFNAAIAAATASGGPATIVIGPGDYWINRPWVIDGEDITVECDSNTVIRTTSATGNVGCAVAFIGHGVLTPNNISTPQRNSFRWKGGKIIATGSDGSDNALGVVRVKNCHISDVTLDADRKGLSAQYGIDNIVWERIVVTRAGLNGITVETACHRVEIRASHVIAATGIGVNVTSGDVGQPNSDVLIDGVVVGACTTGFSVGLTDRIVIRRCVSTAATVQDLNLAELTGLSVDATNQFTTVTVGTNVSYKKPRKQIIPLRASWVAAPGKQDAPSVYLTGDGFVVLVGAMSGGTASANTKIGTLPLGARPAYRVRFHADNGGTVPADIYIDPSGEMFLAAAASNVILSLDGITFPVA